MIKHLLSEPKGVFNMKGLRFSELEKMEKADDKAAQEIYQSTHRSPETEQIEQAHTDDDDQDWGDDFLPDDDREPGEYMPVGF